jgi:two-component system response regulator AtoC
VASPVLRTPSELSAAWSATNDRTLSVEENEKRLLHEALVKARGNRTRAAQMMGISRRTLHRKLAQWPDLDVSDS